MDRKWREKGSGQAIKVVVVRPEEPNPEALDAVYEILATAKTG